MFMAVTLGAFSSPSETDFARDRPESSAGSECTDACSTGTTRPNELPQDWLTSALTCPAEMARRNLSTVPEYSFAFAFENNFDIEGVKDWVFSFYHASIYFALAYLVLVFAGQAYMKNRPPYNMRVLLVLWNTVLAVMSIWGSLRVVPELYHVLKNFGFKYSMCVDSIYFDSPITACWVFVFIMSKIAELMDTVFVVLRKQKLMFIHWFHHSSVLVFSFFLVRDRVAMGRWFMSMNYLVHSFMYTYYAARALKIRVPKKIAMFITTAQIAQMVVGFYISIRGYHMWYTQEDSCLISGRIATAAIVLYSFYFTLFLNYFFKSYLRPRFLRLHVKTHVKIQ